ncbi:unnamed protein product, partial [Medioppia subpectinata]
MKFIMKLSADIFVKKNGAKSLMKRQGSISARSTEPVELVLHLKPLLSSDEWLESLGSKAYKLMPNQLSKEYQQKALVRKKRIDDQNVGESQLSRCLSLFDLTCLGIGSTLGLGVYVLAGNVASRNSGPALRSLLSSL